jgi:hypothetical protein
MTTGRWVYSGGVPFRNGHIHTKYMIYYIYPMEPSISKILQQPNLSVAKEKEDQTGTNPSLDIPKKVF